MATQVIPFDAQSAVIPAYAEAAFGDSANIGPKASIPSLSFKGKVWRIAMGGEETVITRKNQDGEDEPTPIVKMVVLNFLKGRSRTYYEGAYEEGKAAAPRCSSIDGVKPDESISEPMSPTCAACPMSAKGSKVTDAGKATTACAQGKRLVVVPASKLDFQPLLLRLAPTSIWDKDNAENEAKGWYAWDQYVDWLRSKGVKNTAMVVTHIKFDQRVAYPKLLFKGAGWLDDAGAKATAAIWNSEPVMDILNGKEFAEKKPEQTTGPAGDDDDEGEQVAAAPAAPAAAAPAAAAPAAKPKKPKAAPAAQAAPAAAAPAPTADDDDDDGGDYIPATQASPAAAAAKPVEPAAPAAGGTGLGDLMAEWDD